MLMRRLVPVVAVLLLVACQQGLVDRPAPEIDWFEGTVEEAFEAARAEDKPLFLYWGAVWCPPCHYLKDKIFSKPEFIEQSRRFVAVYLDGDTESAQAWGEKLQTAGYPTVLVMNPAGEEVMRMSSGIAVEEYNDVLDSALAQMRPIKEVLDEVLAGGVEAADPASLELLANYSWGQDKTVELSPEERFETFRTLFERTPDSLPLVKSHFLCGLLGDAADLASDEERTEPVLSVDDVASYRAALVTLLTDRELRNANPFSVAFQSSETIGLLEPEPGEGRDQLTSLWLEAAAGLEDDDEMSVMERLYAIYPRIHLARMQAPDVREGEEAAPLPAEVTDHVRQRVAWASGTVTDDGELQGVMNVMAGLLDRVGLGEEAKTLIETRLQDTLAPHYFMSWLSGLEEDAGNDEAALAWSRRAYDESQGPYTRFQWGSGYVRDALRLAPDELETIEASSTEVLEELLAHEDAFANRNQTRLARLDRSYAEWSADDPERMAVVARVRGLVAATCESFSGGDGEETARARCERFADPPEEADESSS